RMGKGRVRQYRVGRIFAAGAVAAVIVALSLSEPEAAERHQTQTQKPQATPQSAGSSQSAAQPAGAPPIPAAPSLNAGPGIDTLAKHVFLYEADTGTVLFEKAADEHMPTASMS